MEEFRTPMKAIRAKCIDCTGHERGAVRNCTMADCPLHPFRMGKNTDKVKRELTAEQKAELVARLRKSKV